MSEVKDTLIKARALVEKGWMQNDYHDRLEHCFCAVGALMKCGAHDDGPVAEALAAHLDDRSRYFLPSTAIVNFNDQPGRTQAEVLALFDRAIEAAQ